MFIRFNEHNLNTKISIGLGWCCFYIIFVYTYTFLPSTLPHREKSEPWKVSSIKSEKQNKRSEQTRSKPVNPQQAGEQKNRTAEKPWNLIRRVGRVRVESVNERVKREEKKVKKQRSDRRPKKKPPDWTNGIAIASNMPWYAPWSNVIKKKVCRFLLQRYLGQFIEEKLSLDQLNVDFYNGTGTVYDVTLYSQVSDSFPICNNVHFVRAIISSVLLWLSAVPRPRESDDKARFFLLRFSLSGLANHDLGCAGYGWTFSLLQAFYVVFFFEI